MNSSHLIVLFLVSAAAVYLMMVAGVTKHALEWKRAHRSCPSCGRATRDCRCKR